MSRRRLDAKEAKELILTKAKELFSEKGYTRATMEELRKRCDMSKGNLYYHFAKKELIFVQLVIESSNNTMDELDQRLKNVDSTYDKLIKVAEIFGEDCENPLLNYVDEFTKEVDDGEEFVEPLMTAVNRITHTITQIITDGINNGELRDADHEVATNAIFSMLTGTAMVCYSMPNIDVNEYVKIHVDNMTSLLSGLMEKPNE